MSIISITISIIIILFSYFLFKWVSRVVFIVLGVLFLAKGFQLLKERGKEKINEFKNQFDREESNV